MPRPSVRPGAGPGAAADSRRIVGREARAAAHPHLLLVPACESVARRVPHVRVLHERKDTGACTCASECVTSNHTLVSFARACVIACGATVFLTAS